MSASNQNIIAALGAVRTASLFFAGYRPEIGKIKPSQWVSWNLGDTPAEDTTFRIVGERLCEAVALQSGERVLNVTAGSGSSALLASESLPFRDSAFDVVMSGFGAMFAPDHHRMARELLRVCRQGGQIGLTSWTPQSFNGQLLLIVARYVDVQSDLKSPALWGSREYLNELFGHSADALGAKNREHTWRYISPEQMLKQWQSRGGPLYDVFRMVDPNWRNQLSNELLTLVSRFNESGDESVVIRSEYLEFLIHKSTWRV